MRKIRKQSGYTLVEMIVALAIFTIVAVVAVGALVKITGLNRRAQSLQAAMNNVSFALEAMSREIRVGNNYYCVQGLNDWSYSGGTTGLQSHACSNIAEDNNTNGAYIIAFEGSKKGPSCASDERLVTAYVFMPRLDTSNNFIGWYLMKGTQADCDSTLSFNVSAKTSVGLSSVLDDKNVLLTDFRLGVFDLGTSDSFDSVFVRLIGTSGTREIDKNTFDVQTSISQRVHD